MKPYRTHRAWVEEDLRLMGDMQFPILNSVGIHSILWFNLPTDTQELDYMNGLLDDEKSILSLVDTERVVVVRAGRPLSDLGIQILYKDHGAKTMKRLGGMVRPVRKWAVLPVLNVLVLPGATELDGWFVFSRKLHIESNNNIKLSGFNPVQRAHLIREADEEMTFNVFACGNMQNKTTNEPLKGMIKGNAAVADLPSGIDIMTSEDNIKSEIVGGDRAWFIATYQGPKSLYLDRQTIVGNRHLESNPETRATLLDGAAKTLAAVKAGTAGGTITDELASKFVLEGDSFAKMLRRNVNAWRMSGMDLHNSLFLTERTGLTWVESLHLWDSQRDPVTRKRVWDLHKMRVPTPGDIRCQVISEAAARLAGSDIRVPLNAQRWETRLQVMVLNDHDYVHRFINSHGGSDLDDFFGVMARTIKGEKKFIDYRNPNTRGEYTVWDYVEGDWHPTYTTADGEEVSFPPLNKTQWPKQILEALEDGTTSYLELPSQVNPPVEESLRTFTVEDAKNILKTAYDAEQAGGYGSLELAIEAWFLTHGVTQYRAVMPNSEDAIDKFLDASAVEDQTALLGFKDTILEEVIATGKPVDIMVGTRLGREVKVPLTSNGPVSRIKRITEEVVLDFEKRLGQFIRSLEIPAFLEELGNNEFLTKATEVLRESRSAQWAADRKTLGMEERDRKIANLAAQNEVIMDFILSDEDPAARAQRIMAFWYATRTVRTHTTQRINDQPVFGTKLFREDVEDGEPIFHLLNALIYLGIANEIDADPDGNFITKRTVHYRGNKTWDVECRECGEEYKGKSFAALVQYWNSGGINKHHRQ